MPYKENEQHHRSRAMVIVWVLDSWQRFPVDTLQQSMKELIIKPATTDAADAVLPARRPNLVIAEPEEVNEQAAELNVLNALEVGDEEQAKEEEDDLDDDDDEEDAAVSSNSAIPHPAQLKLP